MTIILTNYPYSITYRVAHHKFGFLNYSFRGISIQSSFETRKGLVKKFFHLLSIWFIPGQSASCDCVITQSTDTQTHNIERYSFPSECIIGSRIRLNNDHYRDRKYFEVNIKKKAVLQEHLVVTTNFGVYIQ